MSELKIAPSWSEDPVEYQKARRAKLASRGKRFYEGIDENKETIQCSNCKRTLPLSRFYKDISRLNGYTNWCKDCTAEYQFLYQTGRGYFQGTGICLICGEIHPFKLELHHLFGRKNSDTRIHLCGNCHNVLYFFPLVAWFQRNVNG